MPPTASSCCASRSARRRSRSAVVADPAVPLDALAPPLALLVGALGGSRLLARACGSGESELPAGARLLIGLALFAAASGWLVAGGAYSRGASLALLATAALGFVAREPQASAPFALGSPRLAVAHLPWLFAIGAFLLVRGFGALRFPHYNACDDLTQYLHFPRLMLESGAFEEPFSTRRLGVLGVGPLLQGFFWPHLDVSGNAVADAVLGLPALLGAAAMLCAAASRGVASRHVTLGFALAALCGTLSVPYINTLPVLLPYAAALALFGLHARLALRAPDAASTRDALAFGAVAALAIGLRVSNAILPAALWAFALARALRLRDRERLRHAALAALATALALAPWCLSLWRSSGTPLFPLFAGHYRFDALFAEPMAPARLASFLLECALAARAPLLIAVAALACTLRSQRAVALEIAGAALLLLLATAWTTTAFDSWTVLRYAAPFVVPALLALGALAAFPREGPRWRRPALAALAAAWLLVPVSTHRVFEEVRFSPLGLAADDARDWLRAAEKLVADRFAVERIHGAAQYRAGQAALPPRARVIAAVEQPWEWRFDTQAIHTLDFPGPTSPPPGMPFFRGAEAVADYLTALGYTHFAFTPPRRSLCLYAPSFAQANLRNGQWLWRRWAPYSLDFLRTEVALARSRQVVFRGPTLVVLDLRARVAAGD